MTIDELGMKTANAAGRPVGEYDTKRKEIADATWRVMATSGLEKASMRAIAREAGYTTGALVHYFQNKDELLEFVFTQASNDVKQQLVVALKEDNILDAMREISLGVLPLNEEERGRIVAWQGFLRIAENNPKMALIVNDIRHAIHQQLTHLMQRGQELGIVRDDFAAEDLAEQFDALTEGLSRIAPLEPEHFSAERLTRLVDMHIEMLKKV